MTPAWKENWEMVLPPDKAAARQRLRYNQRIAAGLCVSCGRKRRGKGKTKSRCGKCAEKERERQKQRQRTRVYPPGPHVKNWKHWLQ